MDGSTGLSRLWGFTLCTEGAVCFWKGCWMGIRFDYMLAYLGFSAPSGAAAVWGEWPAPMDLLSLAGLLAEQRKGLGRFVFLSCPQLTCGTKSFQPFFQGTKWLCAVTELNLKRK